MALTIQEAKDAVQVLIDKQIATGEKVITEEALRNIVNDIDIDAGGGKTTVLYSRTTVDDAIRNDPNVRILDNTQASKFLEMAKVGNNPEFVKALTLLYGEEPDLQRSGAGTQANIFVNGMTTDPRTKGLWDMISDKFVREAPDRSELINLVGEKADPNGVFFGTEWKAVKETKVYKRINGINYNQ